MALGMVLPHADDCAYKRTEREKEKAQSYTASLGEEYRYYKCILCGGYHFRIKSEGKAPNEADG